MASLNESTKAAFLKKGEKIKADELLAGLDQLTESKLYAGFSFAYIWSSIGKTGNNVDVVVRYLWTVLKKYI